MSEIKVNYSYLDTYVQGADHGIQFTTTGYDGGDDYSYIAVRSINMAGKDGLHSSVFDHDYRLMAFEFQDYYNANISEGAYNGPTGDKYEVTVQFSDNTAELAKALIQSYSDMMALLFEYTLEAYEDCNYGNVSEQFNPHFITAMTERYADDPNRAPWVQAPLIFAMHRDLLYDDFGGDKLKIAEYAASKSIQISPAAGTPSDIQDFYIESIEALWDEYYSNDGIIGQLLSSVGEDEKKILLTQEYTDLPEVVVADSVDEFVGRFTYYKMNWTEEAEIYKSEEWIRAEFKEYIFGLWEELLANCVGCADAVSGNEYDSSADFGTTDDAANWWSVYALIQRLGEDKTWADYYNHAQDIRTDGPKGRDIMPTDLVQIWEKLGRWLWSTDVSRESMSLDTPREKGSGIDWKKEIRNRYGYTFENDDGDPERTTTGAF
tara:strand:+ start:235 stop:1536 length:1302 start_codon:yes stop_codon:yes gene_type:complete